MKDHAKVVRDDTRARPLSGNRKCKVAAETTPVGGTSEKLRDARGLGVRLLVADSLLDLSKLKLDKRVVEVTPAVVVSKDSASLLLVALIDEPTGRLGNPIYEGELNGGGNTL